MRRLSIQGCYKPRKVRTTIPSEDYPPFETQVQNKTSECGVGQRHNLYPYGSGKACPMNMISWQNGDTEITDMPDCADPFLTRIVHKINDTNKIFGFVV